MGSMFVFSEMEGFPNLEMKDQWLRGSVEGLSVFSLQFLLMRDFKNSVLSKQNRDRNSSIYLGGYMSVQMMCDILWEGVKVCTGLKCEFLICIRTGYVLDICVCVCFWVWVPSKHECEFINVWILKCLTTRKQSRCFNEFLNILISALIFFR